MVSLAEIAESRKLKTLTIDDVFEFLNEKALPIATAKNPLQVIAPAVWMVRRRSKSLRFDLHSGKVSTEILTTRVPRDFGKICDLYIIIAGIYAPENQSKALQLMREREYDRKLIEIIFNLIIESGGNSDNGWKPSEKISRIGFAYSEKMGSLEKEYPYPDFAREEHFKKQTRRVSVFVIFIIVWILFSQGGSLIRQIIELIRSLFNK
ncbi:MAG: hypothetical protein ABIC40_04265 [bacterium]